MTTAPRTRITLATAGGTQVWFPEFSGRHPRLFAARMAKALRQRRVG